MVCPECKGEEDDLCVGCGHCYWCCGYDDGCDGGGRDRRRRVGGLMICPECRKSSVPDFICEGCLLCLACCECFGVDKEHEINPFPNYTNRAAEMANNPMAYEDLRDIYISYIGMKDGEV